MGEARVDDLHLLRFHYRSLSPKGILESFRKFVLSTTVDAVCETYADTTKRGLHFLDLNRCKRPFTSVNSFLALFLSLSLTKSKPPIFNLLLKKKKKIHLSVFVFSPASF
ncbi:hypothetical protein AMTRI_Chr04g184900 [Amborella trichopoda]